MRIAGVHASMVEDIDRQGYSWIEDTSDADMWTLATALGVPAYEARDRQVIKLIRPQAEHLSPPNTLSSRHGTGSFPFHTDAAYWHTPPRFLLLRCLDPGEGGRCTLLTDPRAWLSKQQWDMLSRAVCTIAGSRHFLGTIAARHPEGFTMIRYDSACMRPTNRRSAAASALIDIQIAEAQTIKIHWQHGAVLIVDNYRLLHARSESLVPDPNRLHQKILIEEARHGQPASP